MRYSALVSAMLLSGCYSYQAVRMAEVPVGVPVRARLAPEEAVRVGDILGVETRVFEGQLLSRSDSGTLLLRVPTMVREHAASTGVVYQNVTISAGGVQDIEVRKFNRGRTTAVVVIASVAVASAVTAALVAQLQPNGGPGKGGTDAFLPAPLP